ncbi:hypothetical protein [Barnesiella intestinihominis]|uniref:hypothetical protein n=1 Tax=Barnesiella intestinihominis TaxID=487174 RepID=UPI003AB1F635
MKKRVSATKLYRLWESIKARWYNPKRKDYNNYGGRGITICKEWFCFDAFKNWALENGYNPGLEIDRIDNDGIRYRKSGFITAKQAYDERLIKIEQIKRCYENKLHHRHRPRKQWGYCGLATQPQRNGN